MKFKNIFQQKNTRFTRDIHLLQQKQIISLANLVFFVYVQMQAGISKLTASVHLCGFIRSITPQKHRKAFLALQKLTLLCQGPGSNRRPHPLQGYALPTELPWHVCTKCIYQTICLIHRIKICCILWRCRGERV